MIQLVPASLDYQAQILAFKQAYAERNLTLHGTGELNRFEDLNAWLAYQHAPDGTNLFGFAKVASSTFLALDGEKLVGFVNIRHRLTESLQRFGGHIGYCVHPDHWGKGYATEMLALALEQCRALGIAPVLVTCSVGNPASERVIRKNGGVFENTLPIAEMNITVKRFWIKE